MTKTTGIEPQLIGVKDIARAMSLAEITVRKRLCKGNFPIPSFKVGGRRLFRKSDFEAFVKSAA